MQDQTRVEIQFINQLQVELKMNFIVSSTKNMYIKKRYNIQANLKQILDFWLEINYFAEIIAPRPTQNITGRQMMNQQNDEIVEIDPGGYQYLIENPLSWLLSSRCRRD